MVPSVSQNNNSHFVKYKLLESIKWIRKGAQQLKLFSSTREQQVEQPKSVTNPVKGFFLYKLNNL